MGFEDVLKADAIAVMSSGELSEKVYYESYAGVLTFDGLPLTFDGEEIIYVGTESESQIFERSAVVGRSQVDTADETYGTVPQKMYELFIARDHYTGITAVAKGKDRVKIKITPDSSYVEFIVEDILGYDAGAFHLLLRR
jgi:hypothetical protein